jgi:hypothetical protein
VKGAQAGLAARLNLAPVGKVTAQALEVFVINFVNAINAKLVNPAAGREAVFTTGAAGPARWPACSKTASAAFATTITVAARSAAEAAGPGRTVGRSGRRGRRGGRDSWRGRFRRGAIIRYILIFGSH